LVKPQQAAVAAAASAAENTIQEATPDEQLNAIEEAEGETETGKSIYPK